MHLRSDQAEADLICEPRPTEAPAEIRHLPPAPEPEKRESSRTGRYQARILVACAAIYALTHAGATVLWICPGTGVVLLAVATSVCVYGENNLR